MSAKSGSSTSVKKKAPPKETKVWENMKLDKKMSAGAIAKRKAT